MSSGLLVLVPLLLVVPVALAILVGLAVSARPDHTLSRELVSARRHGVTTSVVAVILQGLGLALAPVVLRRPHVPASTARLTAVCHAARRWHCWPCSWAS